MALGFKSVRECQAHISSTEFSEWQAYDLLEPFGSDRQAMYFGTVAATIANAHATKQSQTRQWYDFFPPYEFSKHQTTEEQIHIVELLNEAFGGIDVRGNKTTPSA